MIELRNVTKFYRTEGQKRIVLDHVSVTFERGHSYALLGVNGAGKSTTMRLLSGAEMPNSGSVTRSVRVSWPLALTTGLNGAMTGIENLAFVSRIYGADIEDVAAFVDEFAEIGDYLEAPIATYSSGMMARFAFGLSMAIEFDCYLVDEVTAVGDARFQRRCRAAFAKRRETADLIFASHSMSAIKDYCDRALVLVDGKMLYFDSVDSAISAYIRLNR